MKSCDLILIMFRYRVMFAAVAIIVLGQVLVSNPKTIATTLPSSSLSLPAEVDTALRHSTLQHGKGKQYSSVLWYPDLSTNDARLRNLLFDFCSNSQYTLRIYQPQDKIILLDDNTTVFHYGHHESIALAPKPPPVPEKPSSTLTVIELRQPLSWMLNRLAQEKTENLRVNKTKETSPSPCGGLSCTISRNQNQYVPEAEPLLTENTTSIKFKNFGKEYFNFLPQNLKLLSLNWFENHLLLSDIEGTIIQEQYSSKDKTQLKKRNKSLECKRISHLKKQKTSMNLSPDLVTSKLEEILQLDDTVILISEYYEENLIILNNYFSTLFFTSSVTSNAKYVNHDLELSVGSPLALKKATNQLEMHENIYQICLKSFFSKYFSMIS